MVKKVWWWGEEIRYGGDKAPEGKFDAKKGNYRRRRKGHEEIRPNAASNQAMQGRLDMVVRCVTDHFG